MPELTASNPEYRATPASVVVAIIGVSVVASIFIFWLVYVHPPVDTAGTSFRFLPALNATLNALCTVFLLFGLRSIKSRRVVAHRNSMFAAFLVSSAFLVSYLATYFLHGETRLPIAQSRSALVHLCDRALCDAYSARDRCAAADPDYIFSVFDGTVSGAPAAGAVDVSDLALCFSKRRVRLRAAGGRAQVMQTDTRKLLTTGGIIFLTGAVAALLMFTVFGGVTKQGPHSNGGWLSLMVAIGCLPTGLLTLFLGGAKYVGDLRRS